MKKLHKKSDLKKESLESYNLFMGCSCKSYCENDSKTSVRTFRDLQVV